MTPDRRGSFLVATAAPTRLPHADWYELTRQSLVVDATVRAMRTLPALHRLIRPIRIPLLVVTGIVLGFAVAEFSYVWRGEAALGNIGLDYTFYVDLGRRWLDTGVMYGDRQLTGLRYAVEINVDNLYPPPAILLFAAFVFLPWFAWYLVPVGLVVLAVWRAQPAIWTWPLMALCVAWPRTQGSFVVGNSDLWSAGFVAAGLLWAWPGVLNLFKPAFAPFALIGIRDRSWWIALAGVAVASLLFAGYWPQYLVAATHWEIPLTRSLTNVPMLLIPIIAWLGRTRATPTTAGEPA